MLQEDASVHTGTLIAVKVKYPRFTVMVFASCVFAAITYPVLEVYLGGECLMSSHDPLWTVNTSWQPLWPAVNSWDLSGFVVRLP